MTQAAEDAVRAYYEAIDAGDYDRFADLLAPGVVHERPDRTIEGRETLVGFMRDDRPQKDTSHEIRTVFAATDGVAGGEAADDGTAGDEAGGNGATDDETVGDGAAVEGRLLDADGNPMFEFADTFDIDAASGRIERIRTYTR